MPLKEKKYCPRCNSANIDKQPYKNARNAFICRDCGYEGKIYELKEKMLLNERARIR